MAELIGGAKRLVDGEAMSMHERGFFVGLTKNIDKEGHMRGERGGRSYSSILRLSIPNHTRRL